MAAVLHRAVNEARLRNLVKDNTHNVAAFTPLRIVSVTARPPRSSCDCGRHARAAALARHRRRHPSARGGIQVAGNTIVLAVKHETRFCISFDGVGLAYAIDGDGPPLVKASNWMTHLEYERRSPVWRHWVKELSRGRTLVRYDERGCGLSDREFDGSL